MVNDDDPAPVVHVKMDLHCPSCGETIEKKEHGAFVCDLGHSFDGILFLGLQRSRAIQLIQAGAELFKENAALLRVVSQILDEDQTSALASFRVEGEAEKSESAADVIAALIQEFRS